MSGLSSTLSLATESLPLFSFAMSSSTGAIILQGPHHSAQKSMTTGTSEPRTDSSKVASESVTMPSDTGWNPFARREKCTRGYWNSDRRGAIPHGGSDDG